MIEGATSAPDVDGIGAMSLVVRKGGVVGANGASDMVGTVGPTGVSVDPIGVTVGAISAPDVENIGVRSLVLGRGGIVGNGAGPVSSEADGSTVVEFSNGGFCTDMDGVGIEDGVSVGPVISGGVVIGIVSG